MKRAKKVKKFFLCSSVKKTSGCPDIAQRLKACYACILLQKAYYHVILSPVAKSKNRRSAFLSLALLFILIALCSLFLGWPHTARAGETYVAHSSSLTIEKDDATPEPLSTATPVLPPAKLPLRPPARPATNNNYPGPFLINGRWLCSAPLVAEIRVKLIPAQGIANNGNSSVPQYTETCVKGGLFFPCSDVMNFRTGQMQPVESIISQDWLAGNVPEATKNNTTYYATGGHIVYTWKDETYGSPEIKIIFGYMQILGFFFITPSILLLGYEIMVGASTFRYAGSLEGLSRVLLGGLAVGASYAVIQMVISLETLVAAAVYLLHVEHPFPHATVNGVPVPYMLSNVTRPGEPAISYRGIVMPMSRWGCAVNDFIGIFSIPFVFNTLGSIIPLLRGFTHLAAMVANVADLMRRIGQMILMILSVILWVQAFVRIVLLNYYILMGPLAFGCWALPGGVGRRVVRLWCKGFFSILFMQVLQLFLLTTVPLLLPTLPQIPLPTDSIGVIQGFLLEMPPILTLWVALMAPRLLGTSAGQALGTAGSMAGGVAVAVSTTASSQIG